MKLFIHVDGLEPLVFENIDIGDNIIQGIGELKLVGKSKIKSVKEIAPIDIERMNSVKEFVERCMSQNRLEQGIYKLGEMGLDASSSQNTGAYIKWCMDDVFREERDIIIESQLDTKMLGKELSTVARQYFLTRV